MDSGVDMYDLNRVMNLLTEVIQFVDYVAVN